MKKIILCLFLPLILTGCKIELNIFSNDEDDKVVSLSGNFDCTNNPGSSDCVQEYDVQDAQVPRAHGCAGAAQAPVFAPAKPAYITSL